MTTSRPTTRRPSIIPTGVMKPQEDDAPSLEMTQHDVPQLGARATAVDLVDRYPDLAGVELARLIDLYRQLSAVDIALMLSDQTLGPKLQLLPGSKASHPSPLRYYAFLLVFA